MYLRNVLLMQASRVVDEEATKILPAHRASQSVAIRHSGNTGDTPLTSAIIQGDAARVDDLITAGVSVISQNEDGLNSLHEAVLHQANTTILDILISAGVSPDVKDIYGSTPLLMGARANDIQTVDFLITYGADIHGQDAEGWTSVLVAVANNFHELLSLLLLRGADINMSGREISILNIAVESADPKTIGILNEAGLRL